MLRTLEDLLLTGKSCVNPSNADTPLAAGTVCGGLDGQGHIGYAAQAGLASFGPDVFTAEHFTAVTTPPGYGAVSGSGPTALYCPVHVALGQGGHNGRPGSGFFGGKAGAAGTSGCGTSGGNGGNGGNGFAAAGHGGNGGNGGNGACSPERWANGIWFTAAGTADDARQHAALQRGRRERRQRRQRWQRVRPVPRWERRQRRQWDTRAARPQRAPGQRRARRSAGRRWLQLQVMRAGAGRARPASACCAASPSSARWSSPVVAVEVGAPVTRLPCRGRRRRGTPPSSRRRRSIHHRRHADRYRGEAGPADRRPGH